MLHWKKGASKGAWPGAELRRPHRMDGWKGQGLVRAGPAPGLSLVGSCGCGIGQGHAWHGGPRCPPLALRGSSFREQDKAVWPQASPGWSLGSHCLCESSQISMSPTLSSKTYLKWLVGLNRQEGTDENSDGTLESVTMFPSPFPPLPPSLLHPCSFPSPPLLSPFSTPGFGLSSRAVRQKVWFFSLL